MTPGVTYAAPDGSTVILQYVIQEGNRFHFNAGTPGEWHTNNPDRVVDVRLLEQSPDGTRMVSYLRSKGGTTDSVYEMRGDEPWPDNPPGILSLPGDDFDDGVKR